MAKIYLKSDPEPSRRARPSWRRQFFWLLPLVIPMALVVEHWRGHYALAALERDMRAQGEVLDPERLCPPSAAEDAEFLDKLAQAVALLPQGLKDYAGSMEGIVAENPWQVRRGSQEPQPLPPGGGKAAITWRELDTLVDEGETALRRLRGLMMNPAPSIGLDFAKRLRESDASPSLVNVRIAAQAVHAATLAELNRGNLPGALEDLEALYAFNRLHVNEPLLANYMMRVAVLGLSDDACWDALQAGGWSAPQLARLQQVCQCDEMLSQMAATHKAERVSRLYSFQWFASHSYEDWQRRYQAVDGVFESMGRKLPVCDTGVAVRRWRQWVFLPLWRFAWADQEEVHYLRTVEKELGILRKAVRQQSWSELNQQLAKCYRDYRPRTASWRFYVRLPLVDGLFDIAGGSAVPTHGYPYPDYSKAWFTTMKNLTIHEMVKTVIALNRYKLRHARWPDSLDALTPEFLSAPPRDFMDGHVLRYRLQPNGSFTLYSVGQDGRDGGGDQTLASANRNAADWSPWEGHDWVWPQSVAWAEAGRNARVAAKAPPSAWAVR